MSALAPSLFMWITTLPPNWSPYFYPEPPAFLNMEALVILSKCKTDNSSQVQCHQQPHLSLREQKPKSLHIRAHMICSTYIISLNSSLITLPLIHSTSATWAPCCASNTPGTLLPQPGMFSPQIHMWLTSSPSPGLLLYQKLCSASHFPATLSKSASCTLNTCYASSLPYIFA